MRNIILLKFISILCLCLISSSSIKAQSSSISKPEDLGLSSERLNRISSTLQSYIDQGKIAGNVTIVARGHQIAHFEAQGYMDVETKKPMQKDAIFRIASMTKLMTSIAILMLYEEGHFLLTDPIQQYLLEFKDLMILDAKTNFDLQNPKTNPSQNSITIQDLLRHTSGIVYGYGRNPIDQIYQQHGFRTWNKPVSEFVKTIAQLPLADQPGTKFNYGYSHDILGYLVEIVSGKTLNVFLQERLFEPLGMKDAGFYVPNEKLDRLTAYHHFGEGQLSVREPASKSPFRHLPVALSGGGGWSDGYGGVVCSTEDFFKLLQMVLNYGKVGDSRILSRKSIELLKTDHLKRITNRSFDPDGYGLGTGVITSMENQGELGTVGALYWAGGPYNTYYYLDFEEKLTAILMMQTSPFTHLGLMDKFRVLALQSIVD